MYYIARYVVGMAPMSHMHLVAGPFLTKELAGEKATELDKHKLSSEAYVILEMIKGD